MKTGESAWAVRTAILQAAEGALNSLDGSYRRRGRVSSSPDRLRIGQGRRWAGVVGFAYWRDW